MMGKIQGKVSKVENIFVSRKEETSVFVQSLSINTPQIQFLQIKQKYNQKFTIVHFNHSALQCVELGEIDGAQYVRN